MGNKLITRFMLILLSCVICMSTTGILWDSPVTIYGVTQESIDDAKANADKIQQALDSVRDEIKSLNSQIKTSKDYIAKFDRAIAGLDTQLYELSNNITILEDSIAQATENLAAAEANVEEQYNMMKLRIKFMYESNNTNYLSVMLASESMSDMLSRAEYIAKISEYDREMMGKYQETVEYITKTKQDLEDGRELLISQQGELDTQKKEYQSLQSKREQEMKKLNSLKSDAQKEEAALYADLSKLEDEIKKMEEEMRNQNPSIPATGKFMWPTVSTRITSDYGDKEGRSSPHKGIDIGAVKPGVWGDPLYAADNGEVTLATYSNSAGNWLWIYHGDGLYTVYMHCSALLVKKGDTVTKGQQIATMGSTGNSSGAHLHFGVRLDGEYVNPWNYVSKP